MKNKEEINKIKERIKDRIELSNSVPGIPLYFGDKREILVLLNEIERLENLVEKTHELLCSMESNEFYEQILIDGPIVPHGYRMVWEKMKDEK